MKTVTYTCDGCGMSGKPNRSRYGYRSTPFEWTTVAVEHPVDSRLARSEMELCPSCAARLMLAISAIAGAA